MPIRFRCAYCNQLMGIARRKAGTVVRCPTCAGQVVVPNPEIGDAPEPATAGRSDPALFERSDFDELFGPGADVPAAVPASGFAPVPQALEPPPLPDPAFDVERIGAAPLAPPAPPHSPPGLFLSPTWITVLSVLTALLIGVAFGVGLLVGLAYRPAETQQKGWYPPHELNRPV